MAVPLLSGLPKKNTEFFFFTNEGEAGMYLSALVLTSLYDLLLYDDFGGAGEMVRQMIRKGYSAEREVFSVPVMAKGFPVKDSLSQFREKYGIMSVFPSGDHFRAELGNLNSLIYPAKEPGRYIVLWTPDDLEKLYIENTTAGYLVRYEDYGVFREVRP